MRFTFNQTRVIDAAWFLLCNPQFDAALDAKIADLDAEYEALIADELDGVYADLAVDLGGVLRDEANDEQ